jgi:hypothetical protein
MGNLRIETGDDEKIVRAHWAMVVLISLACAAVSSSLTRNWFYSLGTVPASIFLARLYLPARVDEIFYRTTFLTGGMTVGYLLFKITERFHI